MFETSLNYVSQVLNKTRGQGMAWWRGPHTVKTRDHSTRVKTLAVMHVTSALCGTEIEQIPGLTEIGQIPGLAGQPHQKMTSFRVSKRFCFKDTRQQAAEDVHHLPLASAQAHTHACNTTHTQRCTHIHVTYNTQRRTHACNTQHTHICM